jgi:hypothetical protein
VSEVCLSFGQHTLSPAGFVAPARQGGMICIRKIDSIEFAGKTQKFFGRFIAVSTRRIADFAQRFAR